MEPTKATLPSAVALLKESYRFYHDHWKNVLLISLTPFVLRAIELILNFFDQGGIGLLLAILASFASFLSFIALIVYLTDTTQEGLQTFKKSFTLLVRFALVGFFGALATLGGIVLLIVPGILIAILISVSPYIVVAENERGLKTLIRSWHYVRNNVGGVFWRGFILILIMIAVYVCIGLFAGPVSIDEPFTFESVPNPIATPIGTIGAIIGTAIDDLVITPIWILYFYFIYLSLRGSTPLELTPEQEKAIRKKLIISIVIGVVGLFALIVVGGLVFAYFLSRLL